MPLRPYAAMEEARAERPATQNADLDKIAQQMGKELEERYRLEVKLLKRGEIAQQVVIAACKEKQADVHQMLARLYWT